MAMVPALPSMVAARSPQQATAQRSHATTVPVPRIPMAAVPSLLAATTQTSQASMVPALPAPTALAPSLLTRGEAGFHLVRVFNVYTWFLF